MGVSHIILKVGQPKINSAHFFLIICLIGINKFKKITEKLARRAKKNTPSSISEGKGQLSVVSKY